MDKPEPNVIKAHSLSKTVETSAGSLDILSSIDLHIKGGESVAIVGESGSGKSTLLGLLAGLDTASSGSIELMGESLNGLNEDGRARLRSRHVGFVFQSFQLMPGLTAQENVMLPLELAGISEPVGKARQLLERVGLQQRTHHYPRQLSGGEQQRVAIARAFATEPDILFADEPTGNLDTKTGRKIADLLFELNKERGTTLMLVTHDEHLAARCERQVQLDAGYIVGESLHDAH